jgi:hypothetical protein
MIKTIASAACCLPHSGQNPLKISLSLTIYLYRVYLVHGLDSEVTPESQEKGAEITQESSDRFDCAYPGN